MHHRMLLLAACLVASPAHAGEVTGEVEHIRDGDTFTINGVDIRLCGIDAPERDDPDYRTALDALRNLTKTSVVRCVQVGDGTVCDGRSRPTNYDRIVAQCFVGDIDIAAALIEQGVVCDWIKFSGGYYSADGKGQPCP